MRMKMHKKTSDNALFRIINTFIKGNVKCTGLEFVVKSEANN